MCRHVAGSALIETVDAIVIGHRNFGERHRFVDVLTPEHGRLSVAVFGIRGSRRRFGGVLDLFMQMRLQLEF